MPRAAQVVTLHSFPGLLCRGPVLGSQEERAVRKNQQAKWKRQGAKDTDHSGR